MRQGQPALGLLDVVRDFRLLDLVQVGLGLKLVIVVVADHGVGGIRDRDLVLRPYPESHAANGFAHRDERIHNMVDRKMTPAVQFGPQHPFVTATFIVPALNRQLIVDVHLVPADLVDHDHRPLGAEPVQLCPELSFLLLHREVGNFGHLCGQFPENGQITFAVGCGAHAVSSLGG